VRTWQTRNTRRNVTECLICRKRSAGAGLLRWQATALPLPMQGWKRRPIYYARRPMNGSSFDRRTQTHPGAHEGLLSAPSAVTSSVAGRAGHCRCRTGRASQAPSARIVCITALIWINEIIYFLYGTVAARSERAGRRAYRRGWPFPSARVGRSPGYVARGMADGTASVIGESLPGRNIPYDLAGSGLADSRGSSRSLSAEAIGYRSSRSPNDGYAWSVATVRPGEQQVH
jgi:hypothetical protein